jgi:hypothetical protein
MLDEREDLTYSDGVQAPDGTTYIIYDYKCTPNGEVLMATSSLATINRRKIASIAASLASILVTWLPGGVALNAQDGGGEA